MNWPSFFVGLACGIFAPFALAVLLAPLLSKNKDNYEDED